MSRAAPSPRRPIPGEGQARAGPEQRFPSPRGRLGGPARGPSSAQGPPSPSSQHRAGEGVWGGLLAGTPTPLCQNLLETRRRSPARSSTHARASPQIDFMVAAVTREEPPAPPPRAPEPVPSRRRSRWSGRDPPPPPYQRQGGGGRATPSNGSAPRQTCSQWRASEGGACSRRRQS